MGHKSRLIKNFFNEKCPKTPINPTQNSTIDKNRTDYILFACLADEHTMSRKILSTTTTSLNTTENLDYSSVSYDKACSTSSKVNNLPFQEETSHSLYIFELIP